MICRVPTKADYQPIIDEVTGEFRADLKRILGEPDGYTLAPAHGRLPKRPSSKLEKGVAP